IIVDEWGPFDWQSPKLWPVDTMRDAARLRVVGPAGRWRFVASEGVESLSARQGRVGDTVTVIPLRGREHDWSGTFEYRGGVTTSPRGVSARADAPVPFGFERFEFAP